MYWTHATLDEALLGARCSVPARTQSCSRPLDMFKMWRLMRLGTLTDLIRRYHLFVIGCLHWVVSSYSYGTSGHSGHGIIALRQSFSAPPNRVLDASLRCKAPSSRGIFGIAAPTRCGLETIGIGPALGSWSYRFPPACTSARGKHRGKRYGVSITQSVSDVHCSDTLDLLGRELPEVGRLSRAGCRVGASTI